MPPVCMFMDVVLCDDRKETDPLDGLFIVTGNVRRTYLRW